MKPILTKHNQHLFNVTPTTYHDEAPPAQRLGMRVGDVTIDRLDDSKCPWHETPEDIAIGLENGLAKEKQLAQIARAMTEVLKLHERVTMELRFRHDLTYREIAVIMERDVSTIHRRVQRSIRKVRRHLGIEE